ASCGRATRALGPLDPTAAPTPTPTTATATIAVAVVADQVAITLAQLVEPLLAADLDDLGHRRLALLHRFEFLSQLGSLLDQPRHRVRHHQGDVGLTLESGALGPTKPNLGGIEVGHRQLGLHRGSRRRGSDRLALVIIPCFVALV